VKVGPVFVKGFIFLVFVLMLAVFALRLHLLPVPPHYDPFMPPDLREPPYWLTTIKMRALDSDPQACASALGQTGLNSLLLPATSTSRTCHLEGTIMLQRLSGAHLRQEQTRCGIAARLYMWERNVVQPSARRNFSQPVREITHFGSYNCRAIHNSSHMSEHATANAFDISGVVLGSGRTISVKRNWNGSGPESAFLHEIHSGLCQYFNLTLSPDYNADHADHFHVDMGWLRDCR
jgi:hypothetical protein